MSASPGVPPALGIEAVEWLGEGGENLTVRITGRWGRRRPTWSGQPLLVIEARGRRHRFPAMPEPPSLAGTAPGTWRMSFSVPASLAPQVGSRGWLQLGAVVVPLPIEVQRGSSVAPPSSLLADPPPRSSEVALEALRKRVVDAERAVRVLGQREHAERVRREELQDELARRTREFEHARHLAAARVDELRGEIATLRRQRDEAEQTAATARCARARAEQKIAELTAALRAAPGRGRVLRAERELASHAPAAGTIYTPVRPPQDGDRRLLAVEARMRAAVGGERAARMQAEARAASLERELQVRDRELHAREDELRKREHQLHERDAAVSSAASDTPAGPLDAARLEAALTRLRDTTPGAAPGDAAARRVTKRWLGPVFREMAKRDPGAAGRLAVALLPALPLVRPLPLAYDFVLSDLGCVAVSSSDGEARVELRDSARPSAQTQLVVTGELAGLGRLLASRPLRRRVRGGLARARGDRSALRVLRSLVRAQLSLAQLHAAGVRPEPSISLRLVSLMVRPGWTRGEDFMIAHRDPEAAEPGAALRVCDKATVFVGEAVELRPGTTTVVCRAESLLAVLAGAPAPDLEIEGDAAPLAQLQVWLKHAQSG